jgi:Cdc6-like AAA superfamily ATPase
MAQEQPDWGALSFEAGRAFNPHSPVSEKALFAGRVSQLRRVVDAINQQGQHAMVFGERGVGKTSLVNVLSQYLTIPQVLAPRVNCDATDSFDSVWAKVFDQIQLLRAGKAMGFVGAPQQTLFNPNDLLNGHPATPDGVRRVLTVLSQTFNPIVIFDEFDRLHVDARRAMADTIKSLSDDAVRGTVVLVGVGDSVDQLLEAHQSVSRATAQVQMPRMSGAEIREIITTGLGRLGMTIAPKALARIELLAQGLPHYAHLIGLHSTRSALDAHVMEVGLDHVSTAMQTAIEAAHQSIRTDYLSAVRSQRPGGLFADVLLAAALTKKDEHGFFAAGDLRGPLKEITKKSYDIPSYAQHLKEFSEAKRKHVLTKTGGRRMYRFRFTDPLMEPFVVMKGVANDKVPTRYLESV